MSTPSPAPVDIDAIIRILEPVADLNAVSRAECVSRLSAKHSRLQQLPETLQALRRYKESITQFDAQRDTIERYEAQIQALEREKAAAEKQLAKEQWTSVAYRWAEAMSSFTPDLPAGASIMDIQALFQAANHLVAPGCNMDAVVEGLDQDLALHNIWLCFGIVMRGEAIRARESLQCSGDCTGRRCVELLYEKVAGNDQQVSVGIYLRWASTSHS
ncbi:hypothetical protein ACEPPN_019320 [Leptodophora sp. 'Broadleaf-Isolate-01']